VSWKIWRKIAKRYQVKSEEIWLRALENGTMTLAQIEHLSDRDSTQSATSLSDLDSPEESSRFKDIGSKELPRRSSKGGGGASPTNNSSLSPTSKKGLLKALRCEVNP
jgi:hypothetical protein